MGVKFINIEGCTILRYDTHCIVTLSQNGCVLISIDNKVYRSKNPLSQQDMQKADTLITNGGYFKFIDFTALGSIFEKQQNGGTICV